MESSILPQTLKSASLQFPNSIRQKVGPIIFGQYLNYLGILSYIYGMDKKLLQGTLSAVILKVLSENGKMYGYELTRKVEEMTQGQMKITEGALYPALHKLEAEGLLSGEQQRVANRVRKYYFLTPNGELAEEGKADEMQQFIQALQMIFKPNVI